MNTIVTIINGMGQVGKDTFINNFRLECKDVLKANVINYSTIDIFKEISMKLGWDGKSKKYKDRVFWKALKSASVEYNDFPSKECVRFIKNERWQATLRNDDYLFLFIHCREPDEIFKIYESASKLESTIVTTLLIDSKRVVPNSVDCDVFYYENYDHTYVINTLEENKTAAKDFLFRVLLGGKS